MNRYPLPGGSERWARRLAVILPAVLVVYFAVFIWSADISRILSFVPDDTAYFLEIAENAAAGNGFTFDGINPTNGYQPLWQFLLVPLYFLVHASPETALRLVLQLQVLLLVVAARWIIGTLDRYLPPSSVLVSTLIYVFYVFVQAVSGMETALLVFLLALLFRIGPAGPAFRQGGGRASFLFGLVLGAVMLARLDMIFLAAAIEALCVVQWILFPDRRREALVRMAGIFLGATLVVTPYLVFNLVQFGHLAPISAQLKHGFPHLADDIGLNKIPRRDLAFGFLASTYLVWSMFQIRRWTRHPGTRTPFEITLAVFALGIGLHLLDVILYVKWAIFSWHFVSYRLFGALIAGLMTAVVLRRSDRLPRQPLYWTGVVLLLLVVGYRIHLKHSVSTVNWSTAVYEAAVWARENTPPEAVFAMKDAGNFGYFSRRRTINLDGLVNNFEFQDALDKRRLTRYLSGLGLDYLVQHAFTDRDDVTAGEYEDVVMRYRSRLHGSDSEEIVLQRQDEVFRSRTYPRFGSETLVVIWKWGP